MSADDKVVYFDQGRARDPFPGLYDRVCQLALRRLTALFGNMMDSVDDALFDRADRAENNEVQTLYFEAMRRVRLRRKEVEEAFREVLDKQFHALKSRHGGDFGGPAELDEDELSLVDNEQLEESLAVEGMVTKARARLALPLSHLRQRLDCVCRRGDITEANNPMDPQFICDAFDRASRHFHIDIQPKLIIFKLFDKYVMAQLPGLYEEVNRLLIDENVLPKLKVSGPVRRTAPSRSPSAAPRPGPSSPPVSNDAEGPATEADEQELFGVLHQLLTQRKYGGGQSRWSGTGYTHASGPEVSIGELIGALSGLQRDDDFEDEPGYFSESEIKQMISQRFGKAVGKSRRLGRAHDDTIDIVSMLFDAILEDPNLPDAIKALIARLQIPVLKVALLDRSFFGHKHHPARELINEMAKAGLGWTESGQPGGDPLYRKIEDIVSRIIRDFDDDVVLFEERLEEFQLFLEDERERARVVEERTRQAAAGKAKVDAAKERVDRELEWRVGGRELSPAVTTLVEDAWAKVLFITLLKEGDESQEWDRLLGVVDRLLWSLEAKVTAEDRKRLVSEIPGLLHDLREGLNGIMFNPVEMTKLFQELEADHIKCLSKPLPAGTPTRDNQESAETLTEVLEDEIDDLAEDGIEDVIDEDELEEFRLKVDQSVVGTWFEFHQDSGRCVRAKLSARLSNGDRLIFVNRAGFKLADRRRDELAEDLRRGAIVLLDDNLLFDKALETVITNLRDLRAGQD